MYNLLRRFLFLFDAEKVHHFSMNALKFICSIPGMKSLLKKMYVPENKSTTVFNITFKNPVGLAAGFDKNAKYLNELEALGFGFVEIGTVTPVAQAGNRTPRLFRLPQDKALINRMGFNNDGVQVVAARLKEWRGRRTKDRRPTTDDRRPTTDNPQPTTRNQQQPATLNLIIGGNIGKNKVTPNEDAWKDYEICFNELHPYVDYFVVNVSSPNTPGLRELQEKESLRKILTLLQTRNSKLANPKPILLKIAPDLTLEQIDDVIALALEINLEGLVVSNTTIDRSRLITPAATLDAIGAGGLSGAPVKQRSTEIIQYITEKTNGQIPVIGSGGIFTAADAAEKTNAGAKLVQVWTGFIYVGPSIAKKIVGPTTDH